MRKLTAQNGRKNVYPKAGNWYYRLSHLEMKQVISLILKAIAFFAGIEFMSEIDMEGLVTFAEVVCNKSVLAVIVLVGAITGATMIDKSL